MQILIVGLVKNVQLERVREEGEKRGHVIEGCYASELSIYSNPEVFEPSLRGRSLKDYDIIYLWTVGRRRWEWYVAMEYLNKKFGTIIVNKVVINPSENYSPTPVLSYLKQVEEKLPFPRSAMVFSHKSVESLIGKFKPPYIVKISTAHQGKGVFLANSVEEVKKIIKEREEPGVSFIIREFIPNEGDIRVFTVGYKAIGGMRRIPKEGEFRSNISLGGTGEKFDLEKYSEIRKIAEKASEITGTEIAGVDIMINKETGKPYILEVNPGPQFMGLEKFTGVNAALEIVKYFEELYNSRK